MGLDGRFRSGLTRSAQAVTVDRLALSRGVVPIRGTVRLTGRWRLITQTTRALLIAATALAIASASASAATTQLNGTFTVLCPKGHPASNAPCPPDAFCGVGSLVGYGPATITIDTEDFQPIPGSQCFAVTRTEEIAPTSQVGILVLDEQGTFCRPGGSGDSHASPQSYGSPGRFDLAYTIANAASTGIFATTSGSGTTIMTVAGGVGVWTVRGSLNTA